MGLDRMRERHTPIGNSLLPSAPYRFIIRLWRADRFGVIASILLESDHKIIPSCTRSWTPQ
jgi:hypothetical protein